MASVIRGSDNFDSGAASGGTFGAVGTYAYLHRLTYTDKIVHNSTYSGSGLYPGGVAHIALSSGSGNVGAGGVIQSAMSGTWRAMGQHNANGLGGNYRPATVFVRIS